MARRKIKEQKAYMKQMKARWEIVAEEEIDDEEFLRRYIEYLQQNCVSSGRRLIIDRLESIYIEMVKNGK